MEDIQPEFIYKYRSVDNFFDLNKDHSLSALFGNYSILSSRISFNDVFDSKIELIKPSPREIKDLSQRLPKHQRFELLKHISRGKYTAEGEVFFSKLKTLFNQKIDTYGIISLSSIPDSNLMWSHYAKSHTGFCIEFKTKHLPAKKVSYVRDIPSLNVIDLYELSFGLLKDAALGMRILEALRCKLDEWAYESEYRFIAAKELTIIMEGARFEKVPYSFDFIESVIFGLRMNDDVKRFIISNMPPETKFKQVVANKSSLRIINYDKS